MRRRNTEIEIIEILLAAAIVVLTVVLAFRASRLTVLYPIVFGLSAVLSALYALEGVLYNRNRVMKKRRIIVFGIISVLLVALTALSVKAILR
ncbi:MAG: hypothetical protein IK088_07755 [Lachnospiraceae bacterium]|nr:hypothetical protein [Lachnospiraceae bacterium]